MNIDNDSGAENREDSGINQGTLWSSVHAAIGVQDFKKVRNIGAYLVDKTPMIDRMLQRTATEVFLFTRPRRFGKSLNLSMIDAYLNLKYKGNTWFDGLKVSELRPDDPLKNSLPVILLDMKDMYAGTVKEAVDTVRSFMTDVYSRYPELGESDRLSQAQRDQYAGYLKGTVADVEVKSSLYRLSCLLEAHYGKKVVILIDEYDTPINHSFDSPELRGILDFFRVFFSRALKGNESLYGAVLTGVLQISKENIFSGLNNLDADNILSTGFGDMFGFTEEEVQKLCSDFGHPEKFAEAKEWYDGYRFGDTDVYCPWSVLKYVDSNFRPDTYWGKTSSNEIIGELTSKTDAQTFSDLTGLASGEEISSPIKLDVTFEELSRPGGRNLYSLMAATGYLRAETKDGGYLISIPNREMRTVYSDVVLDPYDKGNLGHDVRAFCADVLSGDTAAMESSLRALMDSAFSVRMLDSEHVYQAILVSLLLNLQCIYALDADREAGKGYYDIRLRSRDVRHPNIVMEIKRARTSDPSKAAEAALCQIRDRDYCAGLEGEAVLYGIAFSGKDVSIAQGRADGDPAH